MRTVVESTLYEKKVRFRIDKTIKALGSSLCLLSTLLLVWVVISWVDVISHNLEPNATQFMLEWNFFIVCFAKPHMDYDTIETVILAVLLVAQLIMRDGRVKRMFGFILIVIATIISLFINSWIVWVLIPSLLLAVWREYYSITRKD